MADPDLVIAAHQGMALAVCFTPDGKRILSTGVDATTGIWSADGEPVGRLKGHTRSVNSVVTTADSAMVVTGSTDGTVRCWSLADEREELAIHAHRRPVARVAISPDQSIIASASYDSRVRLWSFETGEQLADLNGHPKSVTALAFSPSGDLLASGGLGGDVVVWDPATGREVVRLGGHDVVVAGAAFVDAGTLLSLGYDSVLHTWDTTDWTERHREPIGDTSGFSLSPDNRRLALSSDHHLRVITRDWEVLADHQLEVKGVYGMAWAADGQRLANAGADGWVRVWG